jgi:NodT family efflux transporter outer membrane factor (OMF) lipoprotein
MKSSAALLLLLATGCTAFLPRRATPPEGDLPASFSIEDAGAAPDARWWDDFKNTELTTLVDEAMEANLSLRQLWARLDQARSVVVQTASGFYPQINFEGGARYTRTVTAVDANRPSLLSRLRESVNSGIVRGVNGALRSAGAETTAKTLAGSSTVTSQALPGVGQILAGSIGQVLTGGAQGGGASSPDRVVQESRQFNLTLLASYEVDIWGRIASQYRAADYDYAATREDLESAAITLAAEVADRWIRISEQQELLRILREQLETNRTYLELVELRFRKAQVSALDVYQQRQAVQEIERQIPLVEAQEQVLRHDLAVLLGRPPLSSVAAGGYDLALVPDVPGVGIPAELLLRRPDIRAAWARLEAADYRVAAARADLLPALRLSGGIGHNTRQIRHLFDDWFLTVAGELSAPVFDGFRRRAEVERSLAVTEERLADYRLTILTAIREVEDALVLERYQREQIAALARQLETAQNALREASRRYQRGVSDYLPVLAALERTQSLARILVSSRRELLLYRISLYRALGGTWTQELQAPERFIDEVPTASEAAS